MGIPSKPQVLKYHKVEAEIRQLARCLPVGARLPSEREMAKAFECNFLTIRKGLKQLVADGTIVRRAGSGTFVAHKSADTQTVRRAASNQRDNRLGMIVYRHHDVYAHKVLQALGAAALREQLELRSVWVSDLETEAVQRAEALAAEGCVALVLPWFPLPMSGVVRDLVRRCPIPVCIPQLISGLEDNCFEAPAIFGTGTLLATQGVHRYLRLLGHDRIALLGPAEPGNEILQKMLSAYSVFTSQEGLENLCGLVESTRGAMDTLARRWENHRGALAIVSYDDEHALRLLTAMHKRGLTAPQDFCIVGHNNTEASRYSDPPLTTVSQDFDYIGQWLLRNALALGKGRVNQSTSAARPRLIIRESCGGKSQVNESLCAAIPELVLQAEADQPTVPGITTQLATITQDTSS